MQKVSTVVFMLLFGTVGIAYLHLSSAAKPSVQLYLAPASAQVADGDSFSVQVRIANPSGTSVDYAKVYLAFPINDLAVTSISTTTSNFATGIEQAYNNQTGTLHIVREKNSASKAKDLALATITFQGKAVSSAVVYFSADSFVGLSSHNSNLLSKMSGGTYSIIAPAGAPTSNPTDTSSSETIIPEPANSFGDSLPPSSVDGAAPVDPNQVIVDDSGLLPHAPSSTTQSKINTVQQKTKHSTKRLLATLIGAGIVLIATTLLAIKILLLKRKKAAKESRLAIATSPSIKLEKESTIVATPRTPDAINVNDSPSSPTAGSNTKPSSSVTLPVEPIATNTDSLLSPEEIPHKASTTSTQTAASKSLATEKRVPDMYEAGEKRLDQEGFPEAKE